MDAMTRWLSFHVAYACRHRGACCGAGWPLPVEADRVAPIDRAVASGRLRTLDQEPSWIVAEAEAPPGMAGQLRLLPSGHCVFHHRGGRTGAGCAVHSALGPRALPASCQHFPRICLIDARGVHVTLSHYCPTAAALLFDDDRPVTIVEGPEAVPGWDVPEGLDARDVLPPALTPRVLMDVEGYAAWEQHMVETLAGARARGSSVEGAVALLAEDARALAAWRPGRHPLAAAVRALGGRAGSPPQPCPTPAALFERAREACPAPWSWPPLPEDQNAIDARLVVPGWIGFDRVLRRYLASHAFAAWSAYQGATIEAVVDAVARALAVVRVEAARGAAAAGHFDRAVLLEAIRQADLLLRHYADPARLAQAVPARASDSSASRAGCQASKTTTSGA